MSAGETLDPNEMQRVRRAVRNAESSSGLKFSVFVGPSEGNPRAHAEDLHRSVPDSVRAVLVLCDPTARALEIVTGSEARRTLSDADCALAAASMESSFAGGDIVGGLVLGIQQLGESARAPRTLHANN